jgi:flagellar assembly protein FliH
MHSAFDFTSSHRAILFEEDFDRPPPPPPPSEPEVVEPSFSAAELEAARADAWDEGYAAATEDANTAAARAAGQALANIADQIAAANTEMQATAEQSAEAIAHLVMAGFAAAFPALCARHGATEVNAILRMVLPALYQEPKITVRASPSTAAAITRLIADLDPDLEPRVLLVPTDAMGAGDVRVTWSEGGASRDTAKLWDAIECVLGQSGLLPASTTEHHESAPAPVPRAVKELEHAG